jgi:hypothetical protein
MNALATSLVTLSGHPDGGSKPFCSIKVAMNSRCLSLAGRGGAAAMALSIHPESAFADARTSSGSGKPFSSAIFRAKAVCLSAGFCHRIRRAARK